MNDPTQNFDERPKESVSPRSLHQIIRTDLKAWLDGELPAGRLWLVRFHLLCCKECREEVRWLKRLGEDMRDLEKAVPSPRLRARIMAALPNTPPGGAVRSSASRPSWPRYALASAAALSVFGLAAFAALHSGWPNTGLARANQATGVDRQTLAAKQRTQTVPTANAADEIPPASQIIVPEVTDPTTLAANQLADRLEEEHARRQAEKRHENRANWSKMVAALHSYDTKNHSSHAEHLHLDLSVPDLAEAEIRLQSWAQTVGGTTSASSHPHLAANVQGAAPSATSTTSMSYPTAISDSAAGEVITLRIPLNQVTMLEPVLRQIGALDKTSSLPNVRGYPAGSPETSPPVLTADKSGDRPSKAGRMDIHAEKTVEKGTDESVKPMETVHPADQAAARDGSPKLVTLLIRLDSLDRF